MCECDGCFGVVELYECLFGVYGLCIGDYYVGYGVWDLCGDLYDVVCDVCVVGVFVIVVV